MVGSCELRRGSAFFVFVFYGFLIYFEPSIRLEAAPTKPAATKKPTAATKPATTTKPAATTKQAAATKAAATQATTTKPAKAFVEESNTLIVQKVTSNFGGGKRENIYILVVH